MNHHINHGQVVCCRQFARSTIPVGSEMFEELTQVYSYFHCNSHLCMLLILSSQDDLDWEGQALLVQITETQIPIGFPLDDIDPLTHSDEYGVDLYIDVLNIISHPS